MIEYCNINDINTVEFAKKSRPLISVFIGKCDILFTTERENLSFRCKLLTGPIST